MAKQKDILYRNSFTFAATPNHLDYLPNFSRLPLKRKTIINNYNPHIYNSLALTRFGVWQIFHDYTTTLVLFKAIEKETEIEWNA